MLKLAKWVGIASAGKAMLNIPIVHQLVAGMAAVVGFAILASILAGALIIGGFYAAYLGLVHYGLEPQVALILIAGCALLLMLTLFWVTRNLLLRLRKMPRHLFQPSNPLPVDGIAGAFLDGLMTSRRRRRG